MAVITGTSPGEGTMIQGDEAIFLQRERDEDVEGLNLGCVCIVSMMFFKVTISQRL